eukprot:c13164_g1_i1 orf=499-1026(-)
MPRYTTSQTYTDGNTQIVALPEPNRLELAEVTNPPAESGVTSTLEDEDLEVKLRRISDMVPVRISNTSGSSAGSGSGDFHQYRQMRRKEQDRLARMELDFEKRKEEAEFLARREARIKAAEERTAKKRAKRQKAKERRQQKRKRVETSSCKDGQLIQNSADEDSEDTGLEDAYEK